jgi:hypothetical protein
VADLIFTSPPNDGGAEIDPQRGSKEEQVKAQNPFQKAPSAATAAKVEMLGLTASVILTLVNADEDHDTPKVMRTLVALSYLESRGINLTEAGEVAAGTWGIRNPFEVSGLADLFA